VKPLIIIPTYNEIDNLRPLIQKVLQAAPTVSILVVDDGSPDGTGQLADSLSQENPKVQVLHRAKKMGLGTAYVNGFKWGLEKGFDSLIEMDADFSHDPQYLPTMLKLLETNDVVIGSRNVSGGGTVNWGIGRKILSLGGSFYSRVILGANIRDFTGGFNGWRKPVLEAVHLETLRSDGYSFQIELKYRAHLHKFKIAEFPIIFEDRKVGKSKMNKRIVFEALGRVWSFRLNAIKNGYGPVGRLLGSRATPKV
jgi:dolichol-phosphate mannosyltransferase